MMRARDLIPTILVLVLAVIGPALDDDRRCAASDGPQFRCWLLEERSST